MLSIVSPQGMIPTVVTNYIHISLCKQGICVSTLIRVIIISPLLIYIYIYKTKKKNMQTMVKPSRPPSVPIEQNCSESGLLHMYHHVRTQQVLLAFYLACSYGGWGWGGAGLLQGDVYISVARQHSRGRPRWEELSFVAVRNISYIICHMKQFCLSRTRDL